MGKFGDRGLGEDYPVAGERKRGTFISAAGGVLPLGRRKGGGSEVTRFRIDG